MNAEARALEVKVLIATALPLMGRNEDEITVAFAVSEKVMDCENPIMVLDEVTHHLKAYLYRDYRKSREVVGTIVQLRRNVLVCIGNVLGGAYG